MDRVQDAIRRGNTADLIAAVGGSRVRSTFALRCAIGSRNLEMVQCLVQVCEADANNKPGTRFLERRPIHHAGAYGSVEIAQYFVLECRTDIQARDIRGMTALHLAITHGNSAEMAQCLVSICGANVNAKDNRGRTALHCTSACSRVEMAQCLVQACGADVHARDICGMTALHHAIALGNTNVARYLIEAGADVDAADMSGMTPLQRAASDDCCNELKDTNAHAIGESKHAPMLQLASFTKNAMKMIELLVLPAGGQNEDPQSAALQRAIYSSNARMLQRLVNSAGVNINATDEKGMTALHHVSTSRSDCYAPVDEPNASDGTADLDAATSSTLYWRRIDIATYLVQIGGANIDVQDENGKTALHYCADKVDLETVQFLVAICHANVNIPDSDGCTALHYAVKQRNLEMAQCLIQTGKANVERKDEGGRTVLHYAISNNATLLCRYLLKNGATNVVDSVDNKKMTALHRACVGGCVEIVECLVRYGGANVDATYKNGTTALHHASQRGSLGLITSLVRTCGANVDVADGNGMTALHYASRCNTVHSVEYLLQSGRASVDVMDKNGWTALHHACYAPGTAACISKACTLIKAGASVVAINGDGHNPMHLVSRRGRGYIKLLRLLVARYPNLEKD